MLYLGKWLQQTLRRETRSQASGREKRERTEDHPSVCNLATMRCENTAEVSTHRILILLSINYCDQLEWGTLGTHMVWFNMWNCSRMAWRMCSMSTVCGPVPIQHTTLMHPACNGTCDLQFRDKNERPVYISFDGLIQKKC